MSTETPTPPLIALAVAERLLGATVQPREPEGAEGCVITAVRFVRGSETYVALELDGFQGACYSVDNITSNYRMTGIRLEPMRAGVFYRERGDTFVIAHDDRGDMEFAPRPAFPTGYSNE